MKQKKNLDIYKEVGFEWKTTDEIYEYVKMDSFILLPIGQTEQHGKHLPLNTDSFIAENIALNIAEKIKNKIPVLVMPTIWSGYSMEKVKKWHGTISLKIETFINMVYEIISSIIKMRFEKIVIISTHGNHTGALEVVVRKIADDYGTFIALTVPTIIADQKIKNIIESEDIHGGEYETSLMMYLAPFSVKKEKFTDIDKINVHYKFKGKAFISTWGIYKTKTGIYGDPIKSSGEKGEKILNFIVEEYLNFIEEFYKLKNE